MIHLTLKRLEAPGSLKVRCGGGGGGGFIHVELGGEEVWDVGRAGDGIWSVNTE